MAASVPGRREAQPLHRRHPARGSARRARSRADASRPSANPFPTRLADRLDDRRVRVAEDRRAPRRRCSRDSAGRRRPRRGPRRRARGCSGGRPTARKARTGLLTPPGKSGSRARRGVRRRSVAAGTRRPAVIRPAGRGARRSAGGCPSRIGVSRTVERRLRCRAGRGRGRRTPPGRRSRRRRRSPGRRARTSRPAPGGPSGTVADPHVLVHDRPAAPRARRYQSVALGERVDDEVREPARPPSSDCSWSRRLADVLRRPVRPSSECRTVSHDPSPERSEPGGRTRSRRVDRRRQRQSSRSTPGSRPTTNR